MITITIMVQEDTGEEDPQIYRTIDIKMGAGESDKEFVKQILQTISDQLEEEDARLEDYTISD